MTDMIERVARASVNAIGWPITASWLRGWLWLRDWFRPEIWKRTAP